MSRFSRLFTLIALFCAIASASVAQTLQEGIKFMDIEQYDNARKVFSTLAKQNPVPENLYHFGNYYLNLYKVDSLTSYIDSAKTLFQQGIAKDEKYALNHVGMGAVMMFNKNKEEAKNQFGKAMTITKSKDAEVLYRIGEAYTMYDFKDPVSAIEVLKKAVEKEKKRPDLYMLLGDCYLMQNDGGLANENYDEAIRLDNKSAKAYIKSANVLIRAKNYNDALALYKKGLEVEPTYWPGYREIGELYFLAKRYNEATENYKKYVENSDHNANTQLMYAKFLFKSKSYEEAIKELTKLDKILPDPVIHRLLGYSYFELKQYPQGTENMEIFFKEAIKIIPSDYEYYGRLLLNSGKDTTKAVENLVKAASLDSTKIGVYNELGDMYYKNKKYDRAAELYNNAFTASPAKAQPQICLNIGKSYYFAKNYIMADTTFSKLVQLLPESPTSYLWKARAKNKLDTDQTNPKFLAQPFYEKYIEYILKQKDLEKFKKDIVEAYLFLGSYHNILKKDVAKAKEMWSEVLKYDAENKVAKQALEELK